MDPTGHMATASFEIGYRTPRGGGDTADNNCRSNSYKCHESSTCFDDSTAVDRSTNKEYPTRRTDALSVRTATPTYAAPTLKRTFEATTYRASVGRNTPHVHHCMSLLYRGSCQFLREIEAETHPCARFFGGRPGTKSG